MATSNKLSVKIPSQLPQFLQDEGPNLIAFLKAYYEFLEQTGNPQERLENLLSYNDADTTLNEFIQYFQREVMDNVPTELQADKRLLVKRIRDLYKAKGSENAYRLLFRMMFNEDIEFYYPGEDILRASDGRWVKETTVRLSEPFTGDLSNLGGRKIIGQTSGAEARVFRVEQTVESGLPVYTAYLNSSTVSGTFLDYEIVSTSDGLLKGAILSSVGPLSDVKVLVGGSGHQKGDAVSFTSASGTAANGIVTQTVDTSLAFRLIDGGSGYTTNAEITISSLTGTGATFRINSIANTEIIQTFSDFIEPVANVRLDTGPTFVSGGANTASVGASFAAANVSSTLLSAFEIANTQVGTIASITTLTSGSNYLTIPNISVIEPTVARQNIPDGSGGFKGKNAIITADKQPGAINTVRVVNNGTGYRRTDGVTVSNLSRANTTPATGAPITSGIRELPGSYKDTKGFLSWNMRLEDNFFYQEYSYLIKSTQVVDSYRKFVNDVVHPAGTKLFGSVTITNNVTQQAPTVATTMTNQPWFSVLPDIFIPTIVSDTLQDYIDEGVDGGIDTLPEVEQAQDLSVLDVAMTVGSGFQLEKQLVAAQLSATTTANNIVELYSTLLVLDAGAIGSTVAFGVPTVGYVVEPTSIPSNDTVTTTYGAITISRFAANTVSQLQSVTFNSSVTIDRFGYITVEQ